jgi:hypothetical protein
MLYNKAIQDGIVEQIHYFFGWMKITIHIPESQKIGLDETEIKRKVNMATKKYHISLKLLADKEKIEKNLFNCIAWHSFD